MILNIEERLQKCCPTDVYAVRVLGIQSQVTDLLGQRRVALMEGALSTCPVREGDLFRMRSPNTTAVSYGVVKEIRGQFNEEGATVEWELSAWGAKKNGKINGATRSRINKLYEVELVAKKGSFNSVVNV